MLAVSSRATPISTPRKWQSLGQSPLSPNPLISSAIKSAPARTARFRVTSAPSTTIEAGLFSVISAVRSISQSDPCSHSGSTIDSNTHRRTACIPFHVAVSRMYRPQDKNSGKIVRWSYERYRLQAVTGPPRNAFTTITQRLYGVINKFIECPPHFATRYTQVAGGDRRGCGRLASRRLPFCALSVGSVPGLTANEAEYHDQ